MVREPLQGKQAYCIGKVAKTEPILYTTSNNSFKSVFSVYLNNGTGGFSNPVDYNQGAGNVAVGDFNNDGNLDIVTDGNSTHPSLFVFLNNGTNGYKPPIVTNTTATPFQIAVADFNGDGKQDVAYLGSDGNVTVQFGDGTGHFGIPHVYGLPQGTRAMSITAADLNGDSKPDIAVGGISNDVVFLNNGTGGFGTPSVYSLTQDNPIRIIAADFNGTGKPDLITANNYGNNDGVSILYNNGTGGFRNSNFISLTNSACNANVYSVTVGDFNGDGKLDFATGNQVYNLNNPYATVAVLLNNGHGGFGSPICSGITTFSNLALYDIASADFNGDGKLDVVTVASTYGSSSTDKITVFFGNGTGGFNSQNVISETGYTPIGVAATVPNSGH